MDAKKWLHLGLCLGGCALGAWLFCLLLPALGPFLIGALAAWAAEKPVRRLTQRARLPRRASSFVCVFLLYLLLGGALFFLVWTVARELGGFARELPGLLQSLAGPLARLEKSLTALSRRLPDGIGSGLREGIRSFFKSGAVWGARLYEWLFKTASDFLKKLPDVLFFVFTSVLASFMSSAELPAARAWLLHRVPAEKRQRVRAGFLRLRETFGGWLLAQSKLMGVTFCILTVGFLLLGVDYPLLFGLVIALVDALPVFGTGTVLIPWAIVSFLRLDTTLAVGLLILYAAAALTRQALEPRLVGRQFGLPPLVMLMALYAGFRALGVLGMLVFPLFAVLLKQLLEAARTDFS
jgi:sporulation integral membrane protein YtvI